MFFLLTFIFIITFVVSFYSFKFYIQNQAYSPEIYDRKLWIIDLIKIVWNNVGFVVDYLDSFVNYLLIRLSRNCFQKLNLNLNFMKWCNIDSVDNDDLVKYEIEQLANIICVLYIDMWYDEIKSNSQSSKCDFKFYCQKAIEQAFFNFYKICSTKLNLCNILRQSFEQIELHLIKQKKNENLNIEFSQENEIDFLVDLVDEIFLRVLPKDVNSLLTNCDCCSDKDNSKHCLQSSTNPTRLFIYNLVIYPLILPLIEKYSSCHYIFYNYILFLSHFGGVSIEQFVSTIQNVEHCSLEKSTIFDINASSISIVIL